MEVVIKPPRFGANAISGIGVGAFVAVGGVSGLVLSLMVDSSHGVSVGVAALPVIIGVGLVMPLTLIGRSGTLRSDDDGVRIECRALLRCVRDIPPQQVRYVRYAPPRPAGWSLGFAPSRDSLEIRFLEPGLRAPVPVRDLGVCLLVARCSVHAHPRSSGVRGIDSGGAHAPGSPRHRSARLHRPIALLFELTRCLGR